MKLSRRNDHAIRNFFLIFIPLLFIELIADIILLPADEAIVPAEIIGDAAILALVIGASLAVR